MKVYGSLIRHIVACSFQLKDYCFRTWIKERVRFMCSVLLSAHGLLFWYSRTSIIRTFRLSGLFDYPDFFSGPVFFS